MPQSTWETRELPILTALVEMFDQGYTQLEVGEICEWTDLDRETVEVGLAALNHSRAPEYIDITESSNLAGDTAILAVNHVTGAARRAVGTWPTPESRADEIIAALQAVADKVPDDEQRSTLRRIAGFLGSAGRDFLVDVTAATVNKQLGNG